MALPNSEAMFIVAYPRECTETFQNGHVRAFDFFGGVSSRISYDNARTTVSHIIEDNDESCRIKDAKERTQRKTSKN
jgi:transposase